jgi:hypothetical protein
MAMDLVGARLPRLQIVIVMQIVLLEMPA